MARTIITASEHLQIVGLLSLAKEHSKQLYYIQAALKEIVQEEDRNGHVDDTVWSYIVDSTPVEAAQELERVLNITIEKVDL